MKHFTRPDGPASSFTRPWVAFRAKVRAAAARWCDRLGVEHHASCLGECTPGCSDVSCNECEACHAAWLVIEGLA